MSFVQRAFSTRRSKNEPRFSSMRLGRAATQRGGKPVMRHEISAPVMLLSTTNQTAQQYADIPGTSPIEFCNASSASSITTSTHSSGEDSDASTGSIHSNDTVTDASSVDEAPSPCEPNHLSCYFKPAVETNSPTPSRSSSVSARQLLDAPSLPQRAPSHSKKAHEAVASRSRSMRRLQSPPAIARSLTHSSSDFFNPTRTGFVEAPNESPFGNELAQLDEVAEEYGMVVNDATREEDASHMKSSGLAQFDASDYMAEIHDVMSYFFDADEEASMLDSWV